MLPAITAIGLAIFSLFVWRGAAVSRQIGTFGAALAASSLLLASALLPLPSLASPVCDAFGGPVLLLVAGGGISLVFMAGIDRLHSTLRLRLVTGAASAIALVSAFLLLFAGCIASPYAQLDPLVTSFWVDKVVESMSLATMLQLTPQKVLGFYGFPSMTMGFAAAAGSIGAGPIFSASLVILWPTLAPGRSLVLLALAVSPASFAALGLSAKPLIDLVFKPQMTIAERDASTCQTVSDVASMTRLPKGRVMALIDLGPMILADTDHAVFAAPYHRNNDGIVAMLKLMLAPGPAARQILSDRRVDYVVTCSSAPEQDLVKLAPEGLQAGLA